MVPEGIEKNYFFQHTECDYFPCHEGIPKERFNCMLCYCPLYTLGEDCGGNYTYTSKGAKNCKACNIPHYKNFNFCCVKTAVLIDLLRLHGSLGGMAAGASRLYTACASSQRIRRRP